MAVSSVVAAKEITNTAIKVLARGPGTPIAPQAIVTKRKGEIGGAPPPLSLIIGASTTGLAINNPRNISNCTSFFPNTD